MRIINDYKVNKLLPILAGALTLFLASQALSAAQFNINGTAYTRPNGWYDENSDNSMNGWITMTGTQYYASVSTVTGSGWGKATSYSQSVDTSTNQRIKIVIDSIQSGGLKIGIFQNPWSYEHVYDSITIPGTYYYPVSGVAGYGGVVNMGVELIVEGSTGSGVVAGPIMIEPFPPNTPTNTSTPTVTPSATVSATATPSPTLSPTFTRTSTFTPTRSVTVTGTQTPYYSPTYTPTVTSTATINLNTRTITPTITGTSTVTPTATMVILTSTYTVTPSVTATPTQAPLVLTSTPVTTLSGDSIRPSVNLFRPSKGNMQVYYSAAHTSKVNIRIYNSAGQLVRQLVDAPWNGGAVSAVVNWDGKDDGGNTVASGIYLIRIETDTFKQNIRVGVVK